MAMLVITRWGNLWIFSVRILRLPDLSATYIRWHLQRPVPSWQRVNETCFSTLSQKIAWRALQRWADPSDISGRDINWFTLCIDDPNRNRWFTKFTYYKWWIFPWRTVSHNQMVPFTKRSDLSTNWNRCHLPILNGKENCKWKKEKQQIDSDWPHIFSAFRCITQYHNLYLDL